MVPAAETTTSDPAMTDGRFATGAVTSTVPCDHAAAAASSAGAVAGLATTVTSIGTVVAASARSTPGAQASGSVPPMTTRTASRSERRGVGSARTTAPRSATKRPPRSSQRARAVVGRRSAPTVGSMTTSADWTPKSPSATADTTGRGQPAASAAAPRSAATVAGSP